MRVVAGWLFGFLLLQPARAGEVRVSDAETARKAVREARPGDVVVLAAGEWRDADLRLDGEGAPDQPITIRAEEPGKTVFTGASRIRLGGAHLEVGGLWFKNLTGAEADWLEFRIDSKRRAAGCRLVDCVFTEEGDFAAREKEVRWVGLYGSGNRLERCTLEGKKTKGATVVVWLGEADPGGHALVGNLFRDRPRLGKNGGETLRIGDSKTAEVRAACLVEGNLFLRCDGETECISNKSSGNTYRGNLFLETRGTLTLRHGRECLVEGNVFDGRGRSQTGGIRVIGEGHRVVSNELRRLEGDGFRSAICLVNGIPDSPDNGYHQGVDAEIRGNRVVDCKEALLLGYNDEAEATLAPLRPAFVANLIVAREGRPAVRVGRSPEGAVWKDNHIEGPLEGLEEAAGMRGGDGSGDEAPARLVPGPFGASWRSLPGTDPLP